MLRQAVNRLVVATGKRTVMMECAPAQMYLLDQVTTLYYYYVREKEKDLPIDGSTVATKTMIDYYMQNVLRFLFS